MKKNAQVQDGEKLKYVGDLTIDGDVGVNAQIEIEDGSLIINGAIGEGTTIRVKISETLRNKASQANLSQMMSGSNGYMIINGVKTTFGESISANISMGGRTYIGSVNVANRIYTNNKLVACGNGVYEIAASGTGSSALENMFASMASSSSSRQSNVPSGMAAATIDGIDYIGTLIRVEGKTVIVDGKIQTPSSAPVAAANNEQKLPCKVRILGAIADNVTIISDAEIEANNIGKECVIRSEHAGVTAKNIGEATKITTRNAIKVAHIGTHCSFSSSNDGFTAKKVGNHTTIAVRNAIEVEDIGDFCSINSSNYGITGQNVGVNTRIQVRDAVALHKIGTGSKVTSSNYGITAKDVADNVTIEVRDAVKLKSVGNKCTVISSNYGIDVDDAVGASCKLQGRDAVLTGGLGDHSSLTSSNDKVKVQGPCGNHVVISAKDSVHLKNVGERATIISHNDEVSIRNIGVYSVVRSKDDLDIDGTCPDPSSLQLTSSRGKISRPKKGVQVAPAPTVPPKAVPKTDPTYVTGSFEADLLMALQASLAEGQELVVPKSPDTVKDKLIAPTRGLFAPPKAEKEVAIPKSFECPLTLEVMKDPVMLTLDGKTYERAAISEWLEEHRNSPSNREKMKANQTLDDVLVPNRTLLDAIDEFQQEHPELFAEDVALRN